MLENIIKVSNLNEMGPITFFLSSEIDNIKTEHKLEEGLSHVKVSLLNYRNFQNKQFVI